MVNDEIEKKIKKNTKKHYGSTLVNSLTHKICHETEITS